MKLSFIAHATFTLDLTDGRRIVIDPYEAMTFKGRFNYPPFKTHADFVLVTHEHIDHNYLGDIQNIPVVVRKSWHDKALRITSFFVWHDKFEGTKFGGGVWMKMIEAEGIRLLHMGDCGEILTDEQISALGKIDVLLIPVGGFYTIDGHEAADLARRIGARTTIPCHYKTPLCSLPITGPEEFLLHCTDYHELETHEIDVSRLPSGIAVMKDLYGN
ncbi:MAG: MBL fold metallo-hydrolase [Proteobacteria bacterium]|nr:MBL fold metallo-hydrolase [Pseudomonadota bacterium]